MKYCSKCGKEIDDGAVFCVYCGAEVGVERRRDGQISALKLAARVFMIIATVAYGFTLLPLAWCLPMTLIYSDKILKREPVSLAFKICTLIFVSRIAGILMLCEEDFTLGQ